jgi:FkbM family methyltransferase
MRQRIKRILAATLPQSAYFAINGYVAARDIHSGRRRDAEIDLLSRYVGEGDHVIDVGANHGLYSYHLSKLVGPSGRVDAFEPMPPNLKILRRTLSGSSNVVVHEFGVGEANLTTHFVIPAVKGLPMTGCAHRVVGTDSAGSSFDCQIVRLDDMFPDAKIRFMKLDIEGSELLAFRGANGLLARSRPVVLCELVEEYQQRFCGSVREVLDFFNRLGYTGYRVEGTKLLPPLGDANYVFLP